MSLVTPVLARSDVLSWPVEIRGVWMDRKSIPTTEQGIREMIRSYARAGINLVHPEVIFNGYSSYPSTYLPQKDLYPGVDMLGILLEEAHRHGIEVHPWVWVFRTGNKDDMGGILARHPEWAMQDSKGGEQSESGSYWLSPSVPAVRRLLLNAYVELVEKYDVDGLQLDYVRYPTPDQGYEPYARSRFMAAYGVDPVEIQPFTQAAADWHQWREDRIDSFVALVARELRRVRPSLMVTAAVASFPEQARKNHLQNWTHWAANKWVDYLAPMDYTANNLNFALRVSDSRDKLGETTLLAPGIGIYMHKSPQTMLEQIAIAREAPVNGFTIFATAYLKEVHLRLLREGPTAARADLPFRSPADKARLLLEYAEKTPEGSDAARGAARNLESYASYMRREVGYVAPTPPPVPVIEGIAPLPCAQIPLMSSAPVIDGKLDDAVWQNASVIHLDYSSSGGTASQPTEVRLAYDRSNLYVSYLCAEPDTKDIKAEVRNRDGHVFFEDSADIFVSADPESADYYQFALNTLGVKYEAKGYETAFSPGWQAGTTVGPGSWTAEIAIPFADIGSDTPALGAVWRANFCRNRFTTDPKGQNTCWSPTYGSFHTPIRFGKIVFSGEVK